MYFRFYGWCHVWPRCMDIAALRYWGGVWCLWMPCWNLSFQFRLHRKVSRVKIVAFAFLLWSLSIRTTFCKLLVRILSFLSTFLCFFVVAVAPFKSEFISESILQRLIKQNVIVCFRLIDPSSSDCYLYRSGKHCDYFTMILEGRVQVEFGKENLVFESGPFVFFGVQALSMICLIDRSFNNA